MKYVCTGKVHPESAKVDFEPGKVGESIGWTALVSSFPGTRLGLAPELSLFLPVTCRTRTSFSNDSSGLSASDNSFLG